MKTREQIAEAKDELERSQDWYKDVVVTALKEGSFSAVAEATGLSKDTLQRWKREAGR